MSFSQNSLCDQIVNDMRHLNERVCSAQTAEVYASHELVDWPDGKQAVQTLQLLSREEYTLFGVYRFEDAKILTIPSEIFAHQLEVISLCELEKIKDPRLVELISVIEEVSGEPELDIHGTKFVAAGRGKSISVEREKTVTGETIGFSFRRDSDHNYHMSFYPEQRLTIVTGKKLVDKTIEEADIIFIRDQSKLLIDWAYKVLGC